MAALGLRRSYLTNMSDIPSPALASVSKHELISTDITSLCMRNMISLILLIHSGLTSPILKGPFVRIRHDEVIMCHREATSQVLLNPQPTTTGTPSKTK